MSPSLSAFAASIDRHSVITVFVAFLIGLVLGGFRLSNHRVAPVPSPAKTLLPQLSKDQISRLPYPPDSLPGARDIQTPYGVIRAYEFGPEDGRKVLLVHGISTPCLALGAVAHGLAEKGCRVCLFDLFGRGYSEIPADLPQDLRLFTTQILLVLTSSPLSWTGGNNRFSLVGYSLGGGISAGFTSHFPDLIESLVLIAPSGLIRPHHFSTTNRVIYSEGVIFEPILSRIVKRRLKTPLHPPKKQPDKDKVGAADAVQAEAKIESNSQAPLSKSHPDVTIDKAVVHQVDHHEGFVFAFISSIRYGPIRNQHATWQRICDNLTQNAQTSGSRKVLIVTGDHDPIINKDELQEDARQIFEDRVEFKIIKAAHDLPLVKSADCVEAIWNFWS